MGPSLGPLTPASNNRNVGARTCATSLRFLLVGRGRLTVVGTSVRVKHPFWLHLVRFYIPRESTSAEGPDVVGDVTVNILEVFDEGGVEQEDVRAHLYGRDTRRGFAWYRDGHP